MQYHNDNNNYYLSNTWMFPVTKKTFIHFFPLELPNNLWVSLLLISILQMKKPSFSGVQSHTLPKGESSLYLNPHFPILSIGFFPLICETYIKKGLLTTKVLVLLPHSLGTWRLFHLSTAKAKVALLYHLSRCPLFPSLQCHKGSFFHRIQFLWRDHWEIESGTFPHLFKTYYYSIYIYYI